MRNHCIISGTGRAGTTLLVRVLTRLGFDTGYDADNMPIDAIARAGLEHDVREHSAPYIVKSPWICTYVEELVDRTDLVIDAAIVPIRTLYDAAESRRIVQKKNATTVSVPGGLWMVDKPEDQEILLATLFFDLIFHLTRKEIPIVFVHFPRMIHDA